MFPNSLELDRTNAAMLKAWLCCSGVLPLRGERQATDNYPAKAYTYSHIYHLDEDTHSRRASSSRRAFLCRRCTTI